MRVLELLVARVAHGLQHPYALVLELHLDHFRKDLSRVPGREAGDGDSEGETEEGEERSQTRMGLRSVIEASLRRVYAYSLTPQAPSATPRDGPAPPDGLAYRHGGHAHPHQPM